jgi:hypothetical protein
MAALTGTKELRVRREIQHSTLCRSTGGEFRLIAAMDMDHSVQLCTFKDGPTSACEWCAVRTVAAFPGKFDAGLSLPDCRTVVDRALNKTELEVALASRPELKETFDFLVHVILIPLSHPGDTPPALKFVFSFRVLFLLQRRSRHF